jgi:hypothetical protein
MKAEYEKKYSKALKGYKKILNKYYDMEYSLFGEFAKGRIKELEKKDIK